LKNISKILSFRRLKDIYIYIYIYIYIFKIFQYKVKYKVALPVKFEKSINKGPNRGEMENPLGRKKPLLGKTPFGGERERR